MLTDDYLSPATRPQKIWQDLSSRILTLLCFEDNHSHFRQQRFQLPHSPLPSTRELTLKSQISGNPKRKHPDRLKPSEITLFHDQFLPDHRGPARSAPARINSRPWRRPVRLIENLSVPTFDSAEILALNPRYPPVSKRYDGQWINQMSKAPKK